MYKSFQEGQAGGGAGLAELEPLECWEGPILGVAEVEAVVDDGWLQGTRLRSLNAPLGPFAGKAASWERIAICSAGRTEGAFD